MKTVTFKYDPFGRRIEKKVITSAGTTTTRYLYDNEDILSEYDGNGNLKAAYVHGPGIDEPLSIDKDGVLYYYHADGLGSITDLTDQTEVVVESYTYKPFGELKRYGTAVGNSYTYTGREWDEETGLYYYRARYYDPEVGKFISYDPILRGINHTGGSSCSRSINTLPLTTPQELNGYVYVGNNPVNFVDPLGLRVSNECKGPPCGEDDFLYYSPACCEERCWDFWKCDRAWHYFTPIGATFCFGNIIGCSIICESNPSAY